MKLMCVNQNLVMVGLYSIMTNLSHFFVFTKADDEAMMMIKSY